MFCIIKEEQGKKPQGTKPKKNYLANFRPYTLFSSIGITINTKSKPKTLH